MTRPYKFRAKATTGEWVYGNFIHSKRFEGCSNEYRIHNQETGLESDVLPETVGQFTGLVDKNGKEIFEGDWILAKSIYRTTQTHYGDNIPNGAYTEPMEPGIKELQGEVIYGRDELAFGVIDYDKYDGHFEHLCWLNYPVTIEEVETSLDLNRDWWLFDDKENGEGDLQYLFEITGTSTVDELLNYVNGVELLSNIHDNPDLLQ